MIKPSSMARNIANHTLAARLLMEHVETIRAVHGARKIGSISSETNIQQRRRDD